MVKRTPEPFSYIEPPPCADSSPPGRGVWSRVPDISVVDDTQEALRQAIFEAIHRHAPEIVEAPGKFATHPELTLDWLYSLFQGEANRSPVRLMTSLSDFRQRFRGLFRAHRRNPQQMNRRR